MRRAIVLVLGVAACGGTGDKPASSAPPSYPALERACEEQRKTGAFDRGCMALAMGSARTADCRYSGGSATLHVKVTFAPDGTVPEAVVDLAQPPEAHPEVNACVVAKFREIRMPPFKGAPIHVGKSVQLH